MTGLHSEFVTVQKGAPHGSILGPLLFIIYINELELNVSDANIHFYADDTIFIAVDQLLFRPLKP